MRPLLIALILSFVACAAHAQTATPEPKGSRINLDARASEEVDNDVMRATLFVELEDTDPARLAEKINRATNDALKLAKEYPALRTRTAGYSTYPVSDKNKIVRWRSRSEISVEGEDFKAMTVAIGKLQAGMQLGGIGFSVSNAKRSRLEETLTQAAIAEFLRKADAATKGFKGTTFTVLEATLSADGGQMPPPRPMVMMKSMSAEATAPSFEAGTSRVTVTVNGAILIPR